MKTIDYGTFGQMIKALSFFCLLIVFSPLRCSKNETVTQLKPTVSVKVISIADGDSFTALINGKSQKFRIFGIDAPEKGMPYYKVSKQKLTSLIGGKEVQIDLIETDRYQRSVVHVTLPDQKDVAAEMLKSGLVWHYHQYSHNRKYAEIEANARHKRIGLWQEKNPSPPWEIRAARRNR